MNAYSGHLTKDDEQFHYVLQVVENHRKLYPNVQKQTLALGQQWVAGHHDTPAFEQIIPT